jgi:hypothetical protein
VDGETLRVRQTDAARAADGVLELAR